MLTDVRCLRLAISMLSCGTLWDTLHSVVPMNTLRTVLLIVIAFISVVTPSRSEAASAAQINADANATLHSFVEQIGGARELAHKAVGVLTFPSVVKAGFGFGGEYGEGILLIRGRPSGYYNLVSGSFGFQIGVQAIRDHHVHDQRRRVGSDCDFGRGWID
jgi:hypothetical protein